MSTYGRDTPAAPASLLASALVPHTPAHFAAPRPSSAVAARQRRCTGGRRRFLPPAASSPRAPAPPPSATPTHANPPLAGCAHRCVGVCCCGATDARAARASFVPPRPGPLWNPLHRHSSAPAFAVSMVWWLVGAAGNPVRPFANNKKQAARPRQAGKFFSFTEPEDHPAMPPAHRSGGYNPLHTTALMAQTRLEQGGVGWLSGWPVGAPPR